MRVSTHPDGGVLFRCDVGPTSGVGHLMRCVALAEEFVERGLQVWFSADAASVPWAAQQLADRGLACVNQVLTPEEHVRLAQELGADLVVLDSYLLPNEVDKALRAAGLRVLAIVDDALAGREADLYVNQNFRAEHEEVSLPPGAVRLAGLDYAMMRGEILAARDRQPMPAPSEAGVPCVFAFFGGTDAFGAAPLVTRMLAKTGLPFEATVVAGKADLADRIAGVQLSPTQRVDVIAPTSRLVDRVQAADVVLSASGTSVWELLCLGVAAGLVCVTDNQQAAYDALAESGTVVGLGHLCDLRGSDVEVSRLVDLLSDEALRQRLSARGRRLVDGQGRRRVADAALHLVRDS